MNMVGDGGVEPQWAPPGLVLPKAYKTPAGDISQIIGISLIIAK